MLCRISRSSGCVDVFGGPKQVSPFDARSLRTARIAGGLSLAVDVVVPLMSTGVDVYRCSDGTMSLWSTFRDLVIIVALAAGIALATTIRVVRNVPTHRRAGYVACGVISLGATASVVACLLILQHKPQLPCFD